MRVLQIALHLLEEIAELILVRGGAKGVYEAVLEAGSDCSVAGHSEALVIEGVDIRLGGAAPAL